MPTDTQRAIDAVWRIEAPKLIGGLTRIVRDVGLAEDLAQDALVAALQQWPDDGIPRNPGAWLMAAAKNRAIDHFRRDKLLARKHEELGHAGVPAAASSGRPAAADIEAALDDPVGDDVLRLMFIACHPVLPMEARVALTLRLVGGLTTAEIARAFLSSEPTIAQRIVRAKRTLAEKQVPFETPQGEELKGRIDAVLGVVYLVFNEGYAATAGDEWMRQPLCDDALRLGRILAELVPNESEVLGLVALMEIQSSRARARVSPTGEPILLLDQNRGQWDQLLIHRGLTALDRALRLAGNTPGSYTLQAAIAACHARATTAAETDWSRIAALYAQLAQIAPSPVVHLNRAVAVSMADGPQAGLDIVEELLAEPALRGYHLLPTVRGDLLSKLGRFAEARPEFEKAASLTRNARERAVLLERARGCARS